MCIQWMIQLTLTSYYIIIILTKIKLSSIWTMTGLLSIIYKNAGNTSGAIVSSSL